MARTQLTPQQCGRITPLQDPTANVPDVANGNSFVNTNKNVLMIVKNSNAGTLTLTVDIPGTFEGENLGNKAYVIPTTEEWVIGPFDDDYNQTDNSIANQVLFNCDISSSVTIKLIKFSPANTEV